MTPKRIQRKRVKGWRMPEGTLYVGCPTVFGNPFLHLREYVGIETILALYREMAQGCWNPSLVESLADWQVEGIYQTHCYWLKRIGRPFDEIHIRLRGKDLACWCALDDPCHADILLELANR